MPRQAQEIVINNFKRGLITEATALNFPTDAATETWNCTYDTTGKVVRRKGFDYESGYATNNETRDDDHLAFFEWKNVAGQGDLTFYVVQIGRYVVFYEEDSTAALSAQIKGFEVDLNTYKAATTNPETARCSFSAINGDLFIVNPHIEPVYVRYNVTGDSITTTQISVDIRDLDGLTSAGVTDVEDRSTFTTAGKPSESHLYNLLNQGWYETADYDTAGNSAQVATRWYAVGRGDMPSNADIWWLCKDSNEVFQAITHADRTKPGATQAPRGHYILNAFDFDYTTVSSADFTAFKVSAATDTTAYAAIGTFDTSTDARPSAVATYAQRVWYAGVEEQGWNTNFYYTQLIESEKQYGRCYQTNDPTSEHLSDVLPTDGGVLKIPEVGKVITMRPLGNSLLIFAENGVWAISGGEGAGFKATDFSISKLSEVQSLGAESFITATNAIMWWSIDGIYAAQVQNDQVTIQNLTEQTIQTFYEAIPSQSRHYAQGFYNPEANTIQWVYRSTSNADVDTRYNYNRILTFDLTLQAFYPWTIEELASAPAYINGVISTLVGDNQKFLYFTSKLVSGTTYSFTWSDETDTTFTDWVTVDSTGIDFSSYFVAGYTLYGGAVRDVQSNYVTFFLEDETNASLKVRGRFDFSNAADSGKWSLLQQAYKDTNRADFDVHTTRLKLRGEGLALQIYGESETGKPFTLLGWGISGTANATV